MDSGSSRSQQEISAPKVFLRIKPIDTLNITNDVNTEHYEVEDNKLKVKYMNQKDLCEASYSFTKILIPSSSQEEVYNESIENCVKKFLYENHQLIFAYGTSCSGKSYTIQGTGTNPGIIPRVLLSLFESTKAARDTQPCLCPTYLNLVECISIEQLEELNEYKNYLLELQSSTFPTTSRNTDDTIRNFSNDEIFDAVKDVKIYDVSKIRSTCVYSLWISCIEIYSENIYDLLSRPGVKSVPLKLALDTQRSPYVKDLKWLPVTCHNEAYQLYRFAKSRLHISSTKLNQKSSRSHFIFNIKMIATEIDSSEGCYYGPASLSLCDLAGTERITKSEKECAGINMSLLVLNRCLTALREKTSKDPNILVPYRESKMTRLFQNAFTSDTSITMIANISQSPHILHETLSILGYTATASNIKLARRKVKEKPAGPPICQNCNNLKQVNQLMQERMDRLIADNNQLITENSELVNGKVELKHISGKLKIVEKDRDCWRRKFYEMEEKALEDENATLRGREMELNAENERLKSQITELVRASSITTIKTDDELPQIVIQNATLRKSLSVPDVSGVTTLPKSLQPPKPKRTRRKKMNTPTLKTKSVENVSVMPESSDSDSETPLVTRTTRRTKMLTGKRRPLRRLLTYGNMLEDSFKPPEDVEEEEAQPSPSNLIKKIKSKKK